MGILLDWSFWHRPWPYYLWRKSYEMYWRRSYSSWLFQRILLLICYCYMRLSWVPSRNSFEHNSLYSWSFGWSFLSRKIKIHENCLLYLKLKSEKRWSKRWIVKNEFWNFEKNIFLVVNYSANCHGISCFDMLHLN